MNVAEPADLALGRTAAAVFRVLAGTTSGLSGREVARLSGVSKSRVGVVLRHAEERGLVLGERYGNVVVSTLNREHLAAEAIISLVSLRSRMIDLLSHEVSQWSVAPLHASLYGSAARGDGDERSDLDVLVIRADDSAQDEDAWNAQLYDSGQRIRRATGNSVSWLTLSLADLVRVQREQEPIVDEWRRDGIRLAGRGLDATVRAARKGIA